MNHDTSVDYYLASIDDEIIFSVSVYVICRQGNDSQLATVQLKEKLAQYSVKVKDIRGGLKAWSKQIDTSFPDY